MPSWLLPRLVCPFCRAPLSLSADGDATDGMLSHANGAAGSERYPLIDGVPRLLRETGRAALIAARPAWFERTEERRSLARAWSGTSRSSAVVEGFDYEWSAYGEAESKDHAAVFDLYFDLIEPAAYARDRVVLDAGCGGGRWAAQVARRGPRVIAMDLGQSVDVARRNLAEYDVGVVQADLLDTPIAPASVDSAPDTSGASAARPSRRSCSRRDFGTCASRPDRLTGTPSRAGQGDPAVVADQVVATPVPRRLSSTIWDECDLLSV